MISWMAMTFLNDDVTNDTFVNDDVTNNDIQKREP
jgi:hypothetical protein